MSKAVSALTTPGGGLAANQAQLLADFDIGYVLVQAPVDPQLATVLSNVSGLHPYSTTSGYSLWQLDTLPSRVSVAEPDGTVAPIGSSAVGVAGVRVPAAGGTLMLSEPAGSWSASVDGHALAEVPSPAGSWAQAFRLPRGGGTLSIGQSGLVRDLELLFELLAFLVVASLALPGIHLAEQEAQAAATAGAARKEGRTAGHAAGGRAAAYAGAHSSGLAGGSRPAAGSASAGSPGAGDAADSGDGMDDAAAVAAAGGLASRRDGLATAGQAGPQRLGRGARAKAGRAKAASGGRAGRDKTGRDKSGRDKAGRGGSRTDRDLAAVLDEAAGATGAAGLAAASGSRSGSGRSGAGSPTQRDSGEPDSFQRGSAGRHSGVRDARPYSAADDRRGDDRLTQAWPYAPADEPRHDARADGRLADAWPHAAADEPGTALVRRSDQRPYSPGADEADRIARGGRSSGPPGRAWSYPDEPDLDTGRRDDFSATGPSGRPYDDGEPPRGGSHRSAAGRSPSGRSPGGDRPYPELDADSPADRYPAAGRSPSGRSPAGGWPYPDSGEPGWGSPGSRSPSRGHRDRWQSAEQTAVWPGGDDMLEPLPPLDDPGRAQDRRSARRSAEDSGDWDGLGDDEGLDHRWSGPVSEFEPEFEGDTW